MYNIGIIDSDPQLRMYLKEGADSSFDINILFSYPSLEHLLASKKHTEQSPDVLFLDMELPGLRGAQSIALLKTFFSEADIIITHRNAAEVWNALTQGAKGFLLKPASRDEIKMWLDTIRNAGTLISPEAAKMLIQRLNHLTKSRSPISLQQNLTQREQEVLNELIKGFSYKEVANILSLSVTTINDHIKNIYKKMNVNSKGELLSNVLST